MWFATLMKEYEYGHLKPTTYDNYDTYINTRIVPSIGSYKSRELRPDHVQALLNNMQKSGSRNDVKQEAALMAPLKKSIP